jgi:hypothetical protein
LLERELADPAGKVIGFAFVEFHSRTFGVRGA